MRTLVVPVLVRSHAHGRLAISVSSWHKQKTPHTREWLKSLSANYLFEDPALLGDIKRDTYFRRCEPSYSPEPELQYLTYCRHGVQGHTPIRFVNASITMWSSLRLQRTEKRPVGRHANTTIPDAGNVPRIQYPVCPVGANQLLQLRYKYKFIYIITFTRQNTRQSSKVLTDTANSHAETLAETLNQIAAPKVALHARPGVHDSADSSTCPQITSRT